MIKNRPLLFMRVNGPCRPIVLMGWYDVDAPIMITPPMLLLLLLRACLLCVLPGQPHCLCGSGIIFSLCAISFSSFCRTCWLTGMHLTRRLVCSPSADHEHGSLDGDVDARRPTVGLWLMLSRAA